MARTPRGQKKSDAKMKVESIVYQYLHNANMEYESTQEQNLPANKEGKINVTELSRLMGLSESQRKNHLYGDDDILFEINRHAEIQGILPISNSRYKNQLNEDARHKLAMSNKRAKESDDQLVEVQSQNEKLLLEDRRKQAKIEQLEACIDEYFRTGTMPAIKDID